MSKCPLRLYFNENFTFSPSSSFHTSDASLTKCRSCLTEIVDGKALGDIEFCNDQDPFDLTPILGKYILDHSKSIEAYRAIHAQQQDILRLCRKKLSKRYSTRFTSTIKDEDIIRALHIIQDNQLQEDDTHHIDQVVGEILNGILTDVPKKQQDVETQIRSIVARKSHSVNTVNPAAQPKKYRVVFKKVKALFKRSKSFTSSFTVTSKGITSKVIKDVSDKKVVCTTKGFLGTIEKQFEDFKQRGHKASGKVTYITNPTIYTTTTTYQPFLGMGPKTCSCHKHLVRLQDEFVKQQSEIKLMNSHLQQCLSMLQEYNVKPPMVKRKKRHPYSVNHQVYTNISATRGPYGDRKGRRSDDRILSRRSDDRMARRSDSNIIRPRRRDVASSTDSRRKRKKGCCPCKKKKSKKRGYDDTCSDSCQFREVVPISSTTSTSRTSTSTTSKQRKKKQKKKKKKKKTGCCCRKKKRAKKSDSTLSIDCRCQHDEPRTISSVILHEKAKRKGRKRRDTKDAKNKPVKSKSLETMPKTEEPVKSSDEVIIRTICYPDTCVSKLSGSTSTSNRIQSTSLPSTVTFDVPPCPDPNAAATVGTQYSKFGGAKNKQCNVCGPKRSEQCTCKKCVKGRMKTKRGKGKGKRDVSSSDVSSADKAKKRRRLNCLLRLCKFLCCCPC